MVTQHCGRGDGRRAWGVRLELIERYPIHSFERVLSLIP